MVKPDYYDKFKCIADQCRHTCCAGWEIDIDEETLKRYKKSSGSLGKRLQEAIVMDESPHFKLDEKERCPFLNEQNLCDIYLKAGEKELCQICRDHPRFRNECNGREEIGLGLCCEAAAKLILGKKEKTILIDDGQEAFLLTDPLDQEIFWTRKRAFEIVQDRSRLVKDRADRLLKEFQVCIPQLSQEAWIDFYLSLEQMEGGWSSRLRRCGKQDVEENSLSHLEIPFEQLLVYLLYRHLPQSQGNVDILAQIGYVFVNYKLLYRLCLEEAEEKNCSLEDFCELVRLFSSEIEYSEENTDELLNLIWEENNREQNWL